MLNLDFFDRHEGTKRVFKFEASTIDDDIIIHRMLFSKNRNILILFIHLKEFVKENIRYRVVAQVC